MKVNPYLNFDGTCREAFEFYQSCLGGDIKMIMTFGEIPIEDDNPGGDGTCANGLDMTTCGDRIAHVRLLFGDGAVLMGSDCLPGQFNPNRGTSVALQVTSAEEGAGIFDALAEGGTIAMPYAQTFWAERFGMVTDRFGVPWMVNFEETV